ncbi:protein S-acyltransferase [Malassezia equina]|uniref:Protein S-acyltransferase n=1 Tax=Malassezia equina TaxID=1381935 RepID=A0AAF0IZX5_9BASI|nr:protein S-acyltransferase [Malassezia equina]
MSDTDLSTKRDNEMGFAEDEFDEVRQLHGQPIYPYHHGGSSGSLSDAGLLTDFQDGKFTWSNNALLHQKVSERERGIGRQSHAYLTWFFSFAMVAVFIAELIMASKQTGQAVQTQPSVQPMIGPTSEFLISFGARFVPWAPTWSMPREGAL